MTTKAPDVATGWASDQARLIVDAALARLEAIVQHARRLVQRSAPTVIDINEASIARVSEHTAIAMPDEDVERILRADAKAGLS